jgi:hypothetical protein
MPTLRNSDPDLDFLPIPDPGSRGQKGTGSRIRVRNTAYSTRTFRDEPVFLNVCLPAGWPSLLFGSLLLRRSSSKTVRSIVSPEAAFTESAILNHKAYLYLMHLF